MLNLTDPVSGGGRNNGLSNSLQMLTGSATIESRNASVALNSGTKGTVSHKPSEKGFHLRYISQGLKRSSSIEGHRKSE